MSKLAWFPFFVDDWIAGTYGLRSAERGAYHSAICAQWKSDAAQIIPDDPEELNFICGGPGFSEKVRAKFISLEIDGRKYLRNEKIAEIWLKQNRRYIGRLEAARITNELRAQRDGDRNADRDAQGVANSELRTQNSEKKNSEPKTQNSEPPVKSKKRVSKSSRIPPSAGADALDDSEPLPKRNRKPNPLVEAFEVAYLQVYEVPYQRETKDFVLLANLRKTMNGQLDQESWETAVTNYLATPQGSHTLGDLSKRFATFRRHSLDRYAKPPEKSSLEILDEWIAKEDAKQQVN